MTARPESNAPEILAGAAALLGAYDVVYCDVWGVLHDGRRAFEAAGDALARFRARGGTVVLISNAPQPKERVAEILDERGVRRDAWDAIVSSGDIALAHIADAGYRRLARIGPMPRSQPFFARLPGAVASLAEAEALVVTGLADDATETAESYRALLAGARARALPLVCANPDLVVDVGGRLYPCAGAIAHLYEELGGPVFWAGKPYASAYERARAEALRIRGRDTPRERILVIGDAVRTDLAGAAAAGIDALFVTTGIHAHETMRDGAIDPALLARLLAPPAPPVRAAISRLAW